jgi:hypothetical protein
MSDLKSADGLPTATSALDGRVLVVEHNLKQLRQLVKTLKAIVSNVDGREALGAMPEDGEYSLIIVDFDTFSEEDRSALLARFADRERPAQTRLLLLSDGQSRAALVRLFGGHCVTNLVAKNGDDVDTAELVVTVRKILNRDIFGIEKYFIWGVAPVSLRVRGSADKERIVAAASDYAQNLGINRRLIDHYCSVADEFVTNAVYNGPVDALGKPRHAHVARNQSVTLQEGEEVIVTFCSDGRRLGISTSDPFGSLGVHTLLDYLAKCMRMGEDQVDTKAGGAGLGFYTIFESLSHFIVNMAPGRCTEMVGIIDASGTFKDFSARRKSFNVFTIWR